MNQKNTLMHYELQLVNTASGSGYFSCRPARKLSFENTLELLKQRPNDDFLHKKALSDLAVFEKKPFKKLLNAARRNDPTLLSLVYEAILLHEKFSGLSASFTKAEIKQLAARTPLLYIKSSLLEDQNVHAAWADRFRDNLLNHHPLPPPDSDNLPALFDTETLNALPQTDVHIRDLYDDARTETTTEASEPVPPAETARKAVEKLDALNIFEDVEKRHVASLSPIALLRPWRLHLTVQNRRNAYTLSGIQTSYGKGLSVDAARASCAMEIVERLSSFAGFQQDHIPGYTRNYRLTHARYQNLIEAGTPALNPNDLPLEAPYQNEPLHWLEGSVLSRERYQPLWVPAQCVFLFCNLDEIQLFSGLGSTGLAAGNSMAEAKVSALLEVLERDAESVAPYHPAHCFRIRSDDPAIAPLLASYASLGIQVQLQDLTSPLGVPCYKCFVIQSDGQIAKGTGAHLNGKKALLSALTETQYPFPYGPPSGSGVFGIPDVSLEELPDYSTGSPETDLSLLESLLTRNGCRPVYVDLTRRDLEFPVVRAIVPGMELSADFDRFARISPRLYANYLNLFK